MIRAVEAIVDESGHVRLLEAVELEGLGVPSSRFSTTSPLFTPLRRSS